MMRYNQSSARLLTGRAAFFDNFDTDYGFLSAHPAAEEF
jgi:hypothetical protein